KNEGQMVWLDTCLDGVVTLALGRHAWRFIECHLVADRQFLFAGLHRGRVVNHDICGEIVAILTSWAHDGAHDVVLDVLGGYLAWVPIGDGDALVASKRIR